MDVSSIDGDDYNADDYVEDHVLMTIENKKNELYSKCKD